MNTLYQPKPVMLEIYEFDGLIHMIYKALISLKIKKRLFSAAVLTGAIQLYNLLLNLCCKGICCNTISKLLVQLKLSMVAKIIWAST